MKKNKAFTLVELITVLVILALLALIVTPLVMNIIKKTKNSANKRSVDAYGKAVELAASNYLLETGKKASSFDVLKVEYKGNEVNCEVKEVYKNNVFLSQCKVGDTLVKDSNTSDGYYHYGNDKKFVEIYADLVAKAIRKYIKKNGELPENTSGLEVNNNGLNVSCAKSKINSDKSLYLSECSLGGIDLLDKSTSDGYYHYGEAKYLIGDKINYNGIDFYIIENIDKSSETIHLLKAESITQGEIQDYLSSTELESYINIFPWRTSLQMQYLYKDTCTSFGALEGTNTGCSVDYTTSSVKQIVDVWGNVYLNEEDLVKDSKGYKVRLLTLDDLLDQLGFYTNQSSPTDVGYKTDMEYFNGVSTWTMFTNKDVDNEVLYLSNDTAYKQNIWVDGSINPVINVKISALK